MAEGFNEKLGVDGIVMTKMDGDSRGGAAFSAKGYRQAGLNLWVWAKSFDALEPFHPERMASRILGMGDMLSLIEKAEALLTRRKPKSWKSALRRISLHWKIFWIRWDRSRIWAVSERL